MRLSSLTRLGAAALPAAAALAAAAAAGGASAPSYSAAREAGTTMVTQSRSYIVVMNVVPPEQMYQPAQARSLHPTEGEYILRGLMAPITPDARHFEAHVYSRATGLPVHGLKPTVVVHDETTGRTSSIDMTQMQDVVVGPLDFHYGNNHALPYGHVFDVGVTIRGQRVSYHFRLA